MHTSDEALVASARAGSRDALETLFSRHWPSAWRIAWGVTGSREAAEDVAQEAVLKAFGALNSFDGRRPFGVWLHRIVVNRAIDHVRRERHHAPMDEARTIGYDLEAAVADPTLQAAIGALTPDRRAVVVLRYGLDFTPSEIGMLLDLPVGTVHSRLARALADLRQTLEVADVG